MLQKWQLKKNKSQQINKMKISQQNKKKKKKIYQKVLRK